jgi:hypothetical protein
MEEAALDIFLPVMESAIVLAGHYARACGRSVVLAEDMKIGLMFSTRNVTGRQLGSLYPEVYDSGSESETETEDAQEDPEWVRYTGDDEVALRMNDCIDTWDSWEPDSPAERALKAAVNKANSN